MIDFSGPLGAVEREVIRTADTVAIRMRRRYDAKAEDVWDAITDPDRLGRWFAPVSGDFREGGSFQVKDQAAGEIKRCDRPRLLKVSYGMETSLVEVRLTPDGDEATELLLEHSVPIGMAGSGAGALYVGPGWDVAFLGLGLHLDGEDVGDPVAWEGSPDVQRYSLKVIGAWAEAASGTAEKTEIDAAIEAARGQFAPDVS
jgi:uncharacterized protein YndB with AHSA1/START domain